MEFFLTVDCVPLSIIQTYGKIFWEKRNPILLWSFFRISQTFLLSLPDKSIKIRRIIGYFLPFSASKWSLSSYVHISVSSRRTIVFTSHHLTFDQEKITWLHSQHWWRMTGEMLRSWVIPVLTCLQNSQEMCFSFFLLINCQWSEVWEEKSHSKQCSSLKQCLAVCQVWCRRKCIE